MTSDQDETPIPNAPNPGEQPAPGPKAGRKLIGAFRLPQWFRERAPGPATEEERARLKEWFEQQLREQPLTPDGAAAQPSEIPPKPTQPDESSEG
jgi:hypothetical protein